MSEPPALPPPEPEPTPDAPKEAPPRPLLPWFTGGGFLILAAAIIWVWQNPALPPPPPQAPLSSTLAGQVAALDARVARLEQRPPPAAPDLAALSARITALEQRADSPAPPPDLAALTSRVDAVERKSTPDLGPLDARIANLESAGRKVAADVTQQLDKTNARFAALEKTAGLAARVSAARQALDAGHRLGDVPGAPPALARYAQVDPPTEASLRLAFPAAADAALAASRPSVDGRPLLARIWARAQDLVMIRQGDRVLVGDPAAGVLDRAQNALDAGDLAGAVRAIDGLSGPAAQAMAGWLAQARALLDARGALATWAAQG